MDLPFSRVAKSGAFIALSKIASLVKMSYVVGSYAIFFSLANCVVPLAGAFGGLHASVMVFSGLSIIRFLFGLGFSWHILAFYVPGLCASLYWAQNSFITRLLVPLFCMAFFIAHPIGFQAALYTVFWLAPIVLYLLKRNSIVTNAFGSTFTAHAVGSVIWLYTTPLTAPAWIALMPVVMIERTLFAVGMIGFYHLINALSLKVSVPHLSTGSSVLANVE